MIPIEETGVTQYTGTGSRTYFEYGFTFLEGSGVKVLVDGVTPVFTQQEGGVVITPAPVLNAIVVLFRLTDVDQLRDWVPFESFDADKTEGACDKLIMLKSEAWYRAAMNLTSEHLLDRVILHNDKGTDAHLLIWNEKHPADNTVVNEAGVFAGEVTEDMPEPGTYVEKPDDFCYFQWGQDAPANELLLTSTPYPIEVEDGVRFGVSLDEVSVWSWPKDDFALNYSVQGGYLTPTLISTGPTEDDLELTYSVAGGYLTPTLLTTGPTEDDMEMGYSVEGGYLTPLLKTVDTRDDGARFAMSLELVDVSPAGAVVYDRFSELSVTGLNAHTPDIDNVGTGWAHNLGSMEVNLIGEAELTSNIEAISTIDSGVADGEIYTRHMDNTRDGGQISTSDVVFRYVDNNNYWRFGISDMTGNPWKWGVFRIVAGVETEVAGPADGITGGQAGFEPDMIVTLTGSSIRCQVAFEGIDFNFVDTAHQTATRHGLRLVNSGSPVERASCDRFSVV